MSEAWVRDSAYTSSQAVNKNVGLLWFVNWDDRFPLPLIIRHDGDGGQQLLIFPNHGIVVARLRKAGGTTEAQVMGNLPQLVANRLIKEQR